MALRPPAPVRETLAALMDGIPAARWQDDDQLHCTVRFIGEVDRHRANDVADALLALRHPPIEASLGTIGTFARTGRIHTLWIGMTPVSALSALHAKVERRLAEAGVPADTRAYHPHVTLARFSRSDPPPPDLVARIRPSPSASMSLRELILYESVLGKTGASYEPIARYPLQDGRCNE